LAAFWAPAIAGSPARRPHARRIGQNLVVGQAPVRGPWRPLRPLGSKCKESKLQRPTLFISARNEQPSRTFAAMEADNCALPPGSIPKEEDVMRWIVSLAALALAGSEPAAMAQTTTPDVSAAPSAQNSAAGLAGQD